MFEKAISFNGFANTLGLIRSLVAFSTLSSLLFTNSIDLFSSNKLHFSLFGVITPKTISRFSLFELIATDFALYISIGVLLLVISGYFIKLSSIFHWYISFSFFHSPAIINGGDQIAVLLSFLLIPLCLLDDRKNHWISNKMNKYNNHYKSILAFFSILLLKIQISFIYFHAFFSKLEIREWVNGTALWYYLQNSLFSVNSGVRRWFIDILISNNQLLILSTWSVLFLELMLGISLLLKNNQKQILLILGIFFHIGIFIFMGLFSFAIVMIAALIILCLPLNKTLNESLKNITVIKAFHIIPSVWKNKIR